MKMGLLDVEEYDMNLGRVSGGILIQINTGRVYKYGILKKPYGIEDKIRMSKWLGTVSVPTDIEIFLSKIQKQPTLKNKKRMDMGGEDKVTITTFTLHNDNGEMKLYGSWANQMQFPSPSSVWQRIISWIKAIATHNK